MWFVDNWKKAILGDKPHIAHEMIQKGIALSNADEELLKEKYPWNILDSLIQNYDDKLFEHFLKFAPSSTNINVIDTNKKGFSNQYANYISIEVSLFAFCFKSAISHGNYFVYSYAKSKVTKKEISNPFIWGMERTMLNHILNNSRGGGRDSKKILLSIIEYDPQVNTSCHANYDSYCRSHLGRNRRMMHIYEIPIHTVLGLTNFYKREGLPDFGEKDGDKGNIEILKKLINSGANPNIQDKIGFTPLHHCSHRNQIEYLLSVGANPDIKNKYGNTARESQEALKSIQPFNIPSPFDDIN